MASTSIDDFEKLYSEIKMIEKRDSKLTSKDQINRILRPGNSYFNLNPFEVLQVDYRQTLEEMKKKYKRMSILVHPDKNPDDKERAQVAFDILKKAIESLEDPDELDRCRNRCVEAEERLRAELAKKRKDLKAAGKSIELEEDDPDKFNLALWKMTVKMFAERERRRRMFERRANDEQKRYSEEMIILKEKRATEKEWQANFEDSRGDRIKSWEKFSNKKDKSKKKLATWKPPTTTLEVREKPLPKVGIERDRRDMF